MKDKLYLILGLAFILGSIYLFLQKPAPERYQAEKENWTTEEIIFPGNILQFGEKTIQIEVADSEEEIAQGLSGKEALEKGNGLLFIFETSGKYGFWMKDMRFPIDIIWMDESFTVVGVERRVSPETFPAIFYPEMDVKYVLEVSAGVADELGIDRGSRASLK